MTKDSAKFLQVVDSSCTADHPERHHSIMFEGKVLPVVFKLGEDKILPYEQAIKFNVPGFTLKDTDGKPLVIPAVTGENVKASLAADEVVAKVSELTLSSLKLRVAQKTGGEIFLKAGEDDRDDLIAFLVGAPPAVAAAGGGDLVADEEEDANGAAGLKGELNDQLDAIKAGQGVAPPADVNTVSDAE